jgi:hypothetical protein
VLCCAVLCCAVLCCAVLCCAVLCCAVLCCAVLCCAVLSTRAHTGFSGGITVSSILTSVRDHPLLRRLCLRGRAVDLTGLETLLLNDTSKITEHDIHSIRVGLPMLSLTPILQALGRRPSLTKLGLRCCPLGRDNARLLRNALCNTICLHSLLLGDCTLRSAGLAELAPALYHNTSIKVLDLSGNYLIDMESASLLRDILRTTIP